MATIFLKPVRAFWAPTREGCVRVTSPADKLDLDLLRKRDAAEFARFVRRHESFVLGLCQTLGLSAHDRDDAAAETFAIAYRGLEHFRGEAESLKDLALPHLLSHGDKGAKAVSGSPRGFARGALAIGTPGPADIAQGRETNEAVWHAVARLDVDQSAAIELFYRRGMSVEEVAAVMEIPPGSVKTLLFRARERLKFLLRSFQRI